MKTNLSEEQEVAATRLDSSDLFIEIAATSLVACIVGSLSWAIFAWFSATKIFFLKLILGAGLFYLGCMALLVIFLMLRAIVKFARRDDR